MTEPTRVLFLCTHNSARSQIAEALLRHCGGDFAAASAGTEVTRVHPLALAVLTERGIETSGLYSKHLRDLVGRPFDFVITVCDRARDACPIFPGDTEQLHWSFPDPSTVAGTDEERLRAFRAVRDGLEQHILRFIAEQKPSNGGACMMRAEAEADLIRLPMSEDPSCAPPVPVVHPRPHDVARFKALADETRLTLLLTLLHADAPVCVCNLLPTVGVGQATVSHHLKALRTVGLVAVDRRGIWAHYAIAPDARDWLRAVLA